MKAPTPPLVVPGPFPIRSLSPPQRHSPRLTLRNPITWQNYEPEPSRSRALIPPVLADTLYFAERPRGLGPASYSRLNSSTLAPSTASRPIPGKKRVDSPIGNLQKLPRKRRIEWRKARNPILQDDPSFLPKPLKPKQDWRPSTFIQAENWKRSGGTIDLWASAPAVPKKDKLR